MVVPNKHGVFPAKNDHFGVWNGGTTILGNPHILVSCQGGLLICVSNVDFFPVASGGLGCLPWKQPPDLLGWTHRIPAFLETPTKTISKHETP